MSRSSCDEFVVRYGRHTGPCSDCGLRPSTGFIITLCDECFDAFERRVDLGIQTSVSDAHLIPAFRIGQEDVKP